MAAVMSGSGTSAPVPALAKRMSIDPRSAFTVSLAPAQRGRAQDSSRDDLIIDAALDLLSSNGYHGLTMTDVVARAGVSKATLYRRWTAKADLVADAVATLCPMKTPRNPAPRCATICLRS